MRFGQDQGDRHEAGQATVELALVLPIVASLLLLVVQGVLIARTQLVVQNAVREAARQCSVQPDCDARGVVGVHMDTTFEVSAQVGTDVTISAEASVPVVVPGLRRHSFQVSASATMRVEPGEQTQLPTAADNKL
jgi:hypothetical protein